MEKTTGDRRLPRGFAMRMQALLGEEYESFRQAMEEAPPVRGVRLNPIKAGRAEAVLAPHLLAKIPYTEDGYYCDGSLSGNHPLHLAGALYFQDPGAMSAVPAVSVKKGARVLDMCAAPGGKSAQLAAAIGETGGLLVSNEPVASRCRILAGQMERLGVKNACVTNVYPDKVASWYDRYFDLVLTDAPCSGEGMLRKSEEARQEWSEANVLACAERQRGILDAAARTVKGGGMLLYSTCTFSVEENEGAVADFLDRHPDFSLVAVNDAVRAATADGVTAGFSPALALTRRFYPHRMAGEGQFMALLHRADEAGEGGILYTPGCEKLTNEEKKAVAAFLEDTLEGALAHPVFKRGERLEIIPNGVLPPPHATFAAGVCLGSVTKGRLVPHHAFFAAYGGECRRRLDLSLDDPRLGAYLHGDTVSAEGLDDGFAALLVEGVPLGGGKVVSGVLKNYYPKGLRLP